jgi:DNA-binding NarL/FixJ family response regulator
MRPSPLTPRETDVLSELCTGKSYKMIADALFISEETVRRHLKSIYRKLEVHSKSEAVIKAFQDRLFEP